MRRAMRNASSNNSRKATSDALHGLDALSMHAHERGDCYQPAHLGLPLAACATCLAQRFTQRTVSATSAYASEQIWRSVCISGVSGRHRHDRRANGVTSGRCLQR